MKNYFNRLFRKQTKVEELSEFNFALKIIKSHLNEMEDLTEKSDFLLYVLRTIKADLISSYQANFLYKAHINSQFILFPPFKDCTIGTIDVNFNDTDIFTILWKLSSIPDLLKILKYEPFKCNSNHCGIFYPYINICYVYNGIHSATIGKYYNNGTINADIYDIAKSFERFYTDGSYWYDFETKEKLCKTIDYRVAIIFEVGKMMYNLKNK